MCIYIHTYMHTYTHIRTHIMHAIVAYYSVHGVGVPGLGLRGLGSVPALALRAFCEVEGFSACGLVSSSTLKPSISTVLWAVTTN